MKRSARFVTREEVAERFAGKTVAIVGSGPGSLHNDRGFIDSHQVVVRVNNYKLFPATGKRTDVHYSYYGTAVKKRPDDLRADGVRLCMCKCPDAQFMESAWHRAKGKMAGVDFRHIYRRRTGWWFCDTWIPTTEHFLEHFNLLGGHVPTTGFSAILDVLSFEPKSVYLTGFDFFATGLHNVNERWKAGDPGDPIGHVPDGEMGWLSENLTKYPISVDATLSAALEMAGPISRLRRSVQQAVRATR